MSQTTDPLAPENDDDTSPMAWDDGDVGVPPAQETYPDLVRDPGMGNVPSGTPLARGSQASDF